MTPLLLLLVFCLTVYGQWNPSSSNCPVPLYTDSVGEIFSPNFPQVYDNNDNCTYTIQVPEDQRVRLVFYAFDTEACCDIVSIYDGTAKDPVKRLGQIGGSNHVGAIYESTTNAMLVDFVSDITVRQMGFYAKYAASSALDTLTTPSPATCDSVTLTTPLGFITSPNWPLFYPNSVKCSSLVDAGYGNTVKLDFLGFDLEACCDKVWLYDGMDASSPQMAVLSGQLKDLKSTNYTSTGQYLLVIFKSDITNARPGFIAIHSTETLPPSKVSRN